MALPPQYSLADRRRQDVKQTPSLKADNVHSRGNALARAKTAIRNKAAKDHGMGSISRADAARNPLEVHKSDPKYGVNARTVD